MRIHIFNPENDMALANFSPGYTPPVSIRAYRRKHWRLPELWACPEDVVWDGASSLAHLFDRRARVEELPMICPWGWSPMLVHELEEAGVPRTLMPENDWLSSLRKVSSRITTMEIQKKFGIEVEVCHSVEEVERLQNNWGRIVMKSPWSSSGKGLMHTNMSSWRGWVTRTIASQGAVVVERYVEKTMDFALEFVLHGPDDTEESHMAWCAAPLTSMPAAKATCLGVNVFSTDAYGHFLGNSAASPKEMEAEVLSSLCRTDSLQLLVDTYLDLLPKMAPWYRGPVGVDLMVRTDGMLHQCVEINWRMTMGMVGMLSNRRIGTDK